MSYDNTNTGILSRNERREKETQPEFTGKIDIEGKPYRLAAWVRQRKDGGKFFSLKATPQEETKKDPVESDVPF